MLKSFQLVRRSRPAFNPQNCLITTRNTSALSVPMLRGLDKRWETMSHEERQDIITRLQERQKGPWSELTAAEKRAAWFIAYGEWGPRKPLYEKGDTAYIVKGTAYVILAALVMFVGARMLSAGLPKTMSKEWQEASDKILEKNKANPFSGYSQVQSPSRPDLDLGEPAEDDDDDEDDDE